MGVYSAESSRKQIKIARCTEGILLRLLRLLRQLLGHPQHLLSRACARNGNEDHDGGDDQHADNQPVAAGDAQERLVRVVHSLPCLPMRYGQTGSPKQRVEPGPRPDSTTRTVRGGCHVRVDERRGSRRKVELANVSSNRRRRVCRRTSTGSGCREPGGPFGGGPAGRSRRSDLSWPRELQR